MVVCAALYDWLLVLHILAAMVWFGGVALLNVQSLFVVRRSDPAEVERFVRSLRSIGPVLLAPSTIALVVLGIWMVIDADGWDFEQTWVWLGIAIFVAAFAVGAAFQARAALGAERALDAGDRPTAVAQLTKWMWGMRVILVLLVVATWDMVFKPGI